MNIYYKNLIFLSILNASISKIKTFTMKHNALTQLRSQVTWILAG